MSKVNSHIYYFERLKLSTLIFALLKRHIKLTRNNKYFYIDASFFTEQVVKPVLLFFKLDTSKLVFKLKDIKDKNGELVRERIPRLDLFKFQNEILHSQKFAQLFEPISKKSKLFYYVLRGFTDQTVMVAESANRILFLFEVISLNNRHNNSFSCTFFIKDRPWFEIYQKFAQSYNIELYQTGSYNRSSIKDRVEAMLKRGLMSKNEYFYEDYLQLKHRIKSHNQQFPKLYFLLKNLKYIFLDRDDNRFSLKKNNLFVDGRNDINFENDGYHSDYFWYLNSEFPSQQILTECLTDEEADYFEANNTVGVKMKANLKDLLDISIYDYKVSAKGSLKKEVKQISQFVYRYQTIKEYWQSFFTKNSVKIFLSWNKYSKTQIAIADAIQSCGGVSAIWQLAYDGFPALGATTLSDIVFSFSKISCDIDLKEGSQFKHQIITGYPRTYAQPLLMEQALELRKKMSLAGAEHVIFAIDGNSGGGSRWHTGGSFQRENYLKPIEALMNNPKLGVIFKPKNARSLPERLGSEIYKKLLAAVKTGRCHIYGDLGLRNYTTAAPPMLAALSADLCIHGHLSGTAGMECALIGKPTLLIDREGVPFHNFYELLNKDLVIFNNWDDALNASNDFFRSKNKFKDFGNWDAILPELDPFGDQMGANRIGEYLHSILRGFEEGLGREDAMLKATEIYANKWGLDKIYINETLTEAARLDDK